MEHTVQSFVTLLGQGVKDSIKGVANIWYLDKDSKQQDDTEKEAEKPISILAQRRAERNKGKEMEKKPKEENKVLPRIAQCCAFNGCVFLASYVIFYYLLLPFIGYLTQILFDVLYINALTAVVSTLATGIWGGETTWYYAEVFLATAFNCIWILPLFLLSKIVNSLWFQDIADIAYRKTRGRPRTIPSFSTMIADVLFSIVMQTLFLIQAMLMTLIPLQALAVFLSHVHMCLLYSFYAFEYKWLNMGWEVNRRLAYIEINWPYFLGFGLPLTCITSMTDSNVISGCLFSILFPVFIISANDAQSLTHQFQSPVKVFTVVVYLTNKIFKKSVSRTPFASPFRASPSTSASSTATASTKRVTLQDDRQS